MGQSKDFNKLNKIYVSGNYDKVIRKAGNLKNKTTRNSIPYYFLSLAYMQKYKNDEREFHLTKSIRNLKTAKKYDDSLTIWTLLTNDIEMVKSELNSKAIALSVNKKSKSKKYCQSYLDIFGDTLECYSESFVIVEHKIKEPEEFNESQLLMANNKRDSIRVLGLSLVGVPYVWAGETPKGFDCSGFVKYVFGRVGIILPHNANKISYLGKEVNEMNAKVGDVILFGSRNGDKHKAYHAGIIYNTEGEIKVIHCISKGVHISDNFDQYWKSRVMMITNILDYPENNELTQN